ncbi:MAG: hypothetical protein GTO14_11155 [Anaerolineales bacterium]|nr:hypothetical protein [Anaerolineales bacterium]
MKMPKRIPSPLNSRDDPFTRSQLSNESWLPSLGQATRRFIGMIILLTLALLTTACPQDPPLEPQVQQPSPTHGMQTADDQSPEVELFAAILIYDLTQGTHVPIPGARTSLCDSQAGKDGIVFCPWVYDPATVGEYAVDVNGLWRIRLTAEAEGYQATTVVKRAAIDQPPDFSIGLLPAKLSQTDARYLRVRADFPWEAQAEVLEGDLISIEVLEGSWGAWGGPGGVLNHMGGDGFPGEYRDEMPYPGAPVGALVARIDDDSIFFVGSHSDFMATKDGLLALSINDLYPEDNTGELIVRISSWQPGDNLISNGDFALGMESWQVQANEHCAHCSMGVQPGDLERPFQLTWQRTQSQGMPAAVRAYQRLDLNLAGCPKLLLSFDVRLDSYDYPNSGETVHGSHGEYPAKLTLKFSDPEGAPIIWSLGFLNQVEDSGLANYSLIPQGQWTYFHEMDILSPELWVDEYGNPLPSPSVLHEFNISGSGWDFSGAMTDIELKGCHNPLFPSSPVINSQSANWVKQIARLGNGTIYDAVLSPDGETLAVGGSLGIFLLDWDTLQAISHLQTDVPIFNLAYSPAGTLVAGNTMEKVLLWNVAQQSITMELKVENSWIESLAFSPEGNLLATGTFDDEIILWRVSDGSIEDVLKGHTARVYSLAFSPDGTLLASGSNMGEGALKLWDVHEGTLLRTLEAAEDNRVSAIRFAPHGPFIATVSVNNSIRLWRTTDGRLMQTFVGHKKHITDLAFTPDGETLVSCDNDRTLRAWSLESGEQVLLIENLPAMTHSLQVSLDGTSVAVGMYVDENTIQVYQLPEGTLLRTLEGHSSSITGLAFSPDGVHLTTGSSEGKIRIWDPHDGAHIQDLYEVHPWDIVRGLAYSPDGASLAAGFSTGFHVLQTQDGSPLLKLDERTKDVSHLAYSPDGSFLVTGGYADAVRMWRAKDGELLYTLDDDQYVAFSPDGKIIATWNKQEDLVRLRNAQDGSIWKTLEAEHLDPRQVEFFPDGETLVVVGSSTKFTLWQVSDGTLLQTIEDVYWGSFTRTIALSPDGELIAAGMDDGSIRLWQISKGILLRTLEGHTMEVVRLKFSPDGTRLASGAADGTVRLWAVHE